MAVLTYFTVTGTFLAVGSATSPMTGRITFTPLVGSGDVITADTLSPPASLMLEAVSATVRADGRVKSGDTVGVRLVANTAVLELEGDLFYQVDFYGGLKAGTKSFHPASFTFQAPTSSTTIDLTTVIPIAGTSAAQVAKGPKGDPVDDFTIDGDGNLQFFVDSVPIGEPQALPGASWGTIFGKPAVVAGGATQADARSAIGAGTASTKTDVGLGNVNNTADTAKPVSAAQQTALDGKQPLAGGYVGEICARMTVRPTRARRALMESLVASLLTAGVWTKLDGFYVFAAHDVQAAKLNWVGAAQDITAVNAPTFQIDRGFTGNGTSAYLDTNTAENALEKYTANDATMGIYNRSNIAGSNIIEISAGVKAYLNPAVAGNVAVRANSSAGSIIGPSNGGVNTGLFAWSRDSTTAYVYRAGALLGSGAAASGVLDAVNVTFGQYNNTNYSTRQLAAGFFGQGLSGAEHAALNTALQAYLTAVGA